MRFESAADIRLVRGMRRKKFEPSLFGCIRLNRDLGADLDHTPGRNLKKIGGIARGFGQPDEQTILPVNA
jgi:hypothetical protein